MSMLRVSCSVSFIALTPHPLFSNSIIPPLLLSQTHTLPALRQRQDSVDPQREIKSVFAERPNSAPSCVSLKRRSSSTRAAPPQRRWREVSSETILLLTHYPPPAASLATRVSFHAIIDTRILWSPAHRRHRLCLSFSVSRPPSITFSPSPFPAGVGALSPYFPLSLSVSLISL